MAQAITVDQAKAAVKAAERKLTGIRNGYATCFAGAVKGIRRDEKKAELELVKAQAVLQAARAAARLAKKSAQEG